MNNKTIVRFVLTVFFMVFSSHSFDVSPSRLPELKNKIKMRNDISFGEFRAALINSKNKNSYDICLSKFLSKRDLFSKFRKSDFIWARENIGSLRVSLCSDNFNLPLEEILTGMCKCHLAKNLHHFLEKILEDRDLLQYDDKAVFKLRDWEDDYDTVLRIKFLLNIPGGVFSLPQEEKDTLNRLLLLFPLDASFNDCVKVLRESCNLQNDSMQKMLLPQALFIIHINTSQPWFTYFYSDSYNRDKNFYMNCVVSAIKSISEDILDMHFEYDGSLDNELTMRQQTVLSFIEHFNVPAAQDGTKEKED